MTDLEPQTIAGQLYEQLSHIAASKNINEFKIQAIKRDAKPLLRIAPAIYYNILGRCACVLRNFDEMKRCYDTASNLAPGDSGLWIDRSIGLSMWGFYSEAMDSIRAALRVAPGDPEVVRRAYVQSWQACRFQESIDFVERLKTLKVQYDLEDAKIMSRAAEIFESAAISDDDGMHLADLFGVFLRDKKIFNPSAYIAVVTNQECRDHVIYAFGAGRDNEKIENLNWDAAEYFAQLNVKYESDGIIAFRLVEDTTLRSVSKSES